MFPGDNANAKIVTTFPHKVVETEFDFIELSDGVKLSCRYWFPETACNEPVPAILEYIPYGTRDKTAARDEAMHSYFAGHGYAAIRVDIRGSGESEGLLLDEYLKQEQDDAIEVISWISSQPWCDGQVGMMGKSWGGFNSLQVAARNPTELKCILSVFSTDDRYADDVHYFGGCMAVENPVWAFVMLPILARPPDPDIVGETWEKMWLARLDCLEPWIIRWTKHQRRDKFWQHGSVCENYEKIAIPVYSMGGWADSYSNPVPRLVENISSPIRGLIGPWGHQYMHQTVPGPTAGFLDEALRWWDFWLKGSNTGILEEPKYKVWIQDSVEPNPCFSERPGHWAGEAEWPSSNITEKVFHFNDDKLSVDKGPLKLKIINSPQTVGQCTPFFGNMGAGVPNDPLDQRKDDIHSTCFDSDVLKKNLVILGAPVVTLDLASDQPYAFVCVRLNEIRSNGSSLQITYGVLNLTHRNCHENIEPLVPGERYNVEVKLNDIGHTFESGSIIRVAISNAFWPIVWPSPQPVNLSLNAGSSHLTLPVRPKNNADAQIAELPPPKQAKVHPQKLLRAPKPTTVSSETDIDNGMVTLNFKHDTGLIHIENHGWCFSSEGENIYSILPNDPTSASVNLSIKETYERVGQLEVTIEATQKMYCNATHFMIEAAVSVSNKQKCVFSRNWKESIPRDGI